MLCLLIGTKAEQCQVAKQQNQPKPERSKMAMGCHVQEETCAKCAACTKGRSAHAPNALAQSDDVETTPFSHPGRTLLTFLLERCLRAWALPPLFLAR